MAELIVALDVQTRAEAEAKVTRALLVRKAELPPGLVRPVPSLLHPCALSLLVPLFHTSSLLSLVS